MYFRSVSKEIALYTAILGDQKSTKKTRLLAFLWPLMWFLSQTHVKKHSSDPIRPLKIIWNQRKRLYMQQERPKSRKNGPAQTGQNRPKTGTQAHFGYFFEFSVNICPFEPSEVSFASETVFNRQRHTFQTLKTVISRPRIKIWIAGRPVSRGLGF